MKIIMGGLDHKKANIDIREKFSLTKEQKKKVISKIFENNNIKGCVIISTCNRTEVYLSVVNDDFSIMEYVCERFSMNYDEYKDYFFEFKEELAIKHLCLVASGVESQILGDDQIITQVRESLEFSRDLNYNDSYIETAFKTSIQCAKIIKTNVIIRDVKASSAPLKTREKLLEIYDSLVGKKVVVVGNGHMGRLVSELLITEKADVTITLREYHKGSVTVPKGANTILYHLRYDIFENADIIVSATTSPHYTIKKSEYETLKSHPEVLVDLAVPRDIEPSINSINGVKLFSIDDLGDNSTKLSEEKLEYIDVTIKENIEKYKKWCSYKRKVSK